MKGLEDQVCFRTSFRMLLGRRNTYIALQSTENNGFLVVATTICVAIRVQAPCFHGTEYSDAWAAHVHMSSRNDSQTSTCHVGHQLQFLQFCLNLPWGHGLHFPQFCFSLPCGHPAQIAQSFLTLPCGQGLQLLAFPALFSRHISMFTTRLKQVLLGPKTFTTTSMHFSFNIPHWKFEDSTNLCVSASWYALKSRPALKPLVL